MIRWTRIEELINDIDKMNIRIEKCKLKGDVSGAAELIMKRKIFIDALESLKKLEGIESN